MHNIYNYTSALKLDLPCKLKIIMGTQHWLVYRIIDYKEKRLETAADHVLNVHI